LPTLKATMMDILAISRWITR